MDGTPDRPPVGLKREQLSLYSVSRNDVTMDFEWDESKADANNKRHGVTFWEAAEVFGDELSSFVSDPDHSLGEDRYLLFGKTQGGKFLVVSFTERAEIIRIISARHMKPSERKAYEQ